MNAIESNDFTETLEALGSILPKPKAVLCISAHWMTEGTWVTEMTQPKTIHDFFGFPEALFAVRYPAPGSPELAQRIRQTVSDPVVAGDQEKWGLDHGAWSVLRHIFPRANVPVVQLSLDMSRPPEFHYQLGQQLKSLRDEGILIVGSGNIVHNLRKIRWELNPKPYDWALEFDDWVRLMIEVRDAQALFSKYHKTEAGRLSVPTLDHYLPLLYVLGAADDTDTLRLEHEEIQNGSISMRSVSFSTR